MNPTPVTSLCFLGQPACHDAARFGTKAAQLSRLSAEYRVPPGFCLAAGSNPASLREQILAAYASLGSPAVAVRSSGLDEDGGSASFAGQYSTYLNIRGERALLEAIDACRAAAAEPRLADYRRSHGLAPAPAGMGVLVQSLIAADAAAVVFSLDPVSGARDVVVNACYGLGESLVSGSVTPDSWRLSRQGEVLSALPALKERMTILGEQGSLEVAVPRLLRSKPCLSPAQLRELALLAVSLEARLGWPVDLECAWKEDQLYLLQCRPVTALPNS